MDCCINMYAEFEQELQRECTAGVNELLQHGRRHTQDPAQVRNDEH